MDRFLTGFAKKGRCPAIVAGLLLFVYSGLVSALGIGSIKLDSALDQPLVAHIEILGIQGNELDSLSISLASDEVYERMGIERVDMLDTLKFRIDQLEDGNHVIRVYTTQAVSEPFLNFLIEVNWASGRLLREFTVLLDPPLFGEEKAAPVESPDTAAPPEVVIPEPAIEAADVAVTPPPVVSVAPELDEAPAVDMGQIEYGKIKRGENLWKIAEQLRADDVSIEQMMLALYRSNPEAFFGNNISMLKEGAVLRLDNMDKAKSIANDDALAEVAKHNADWLAYRRERQAARAIAAESATRTPTGMEGAQEVEVSKVEAEEPLLQLVTPEPEEIEAAESAGTAGGQEELQTKVNSLRIELAMANEMLEAARQENSDLRNRISSLETQINQINSLIDLKDQELSAMREAAPGEERESLGSSLELSLDSEESLADQAVPAAPAAERPVPEKTIWDDPLTIATLVGLALIPALFALIFGRKRRAKKEETEEAVAEEPVFEGVSEFEGQQAEQEANVELNALTDLGFADSEPDTGGEHVIDPLSESDVYLAYGKYEKAEELLKSAIESDADRQELKLKLLEVYSLSGNQADFDERAEELYAAIGGDSTHPLWQKAAEFARNVSPSNPLFESETSEIELQEELVDESVLDDLSVIPSELETLDADVVSEEAEKSQPQLVSEGKSEFDIAEAPEPESGLPPIDWPPKQVAELEGEELPEPDTEFVSVGYVSEPSEEGISISELDEENLTELDIASAPEKVVLEPEEPKVEKPSEVEQELSDVFAEEEIPSISGEVEFDESSMFLLDDEVGTKLDLARAYIEMGDKDGARELLNEVQQEGDDKQKRDAKVLMSLTD